MTSSECFVYITLPGKTDRVTAGKCRLEHRDDGIAVGHFIYGKSYLSRPDAVEIDPVELQLSTKQYQTVRLKGVFGAIRDSAPDYWGRKLIAMHMDKASPDEMDYLLYSADDRIGALGFGLHQTPPSPVPAFNKRMQLAQLQEEAEAIIQEEGEDNLSNASMRARIRAFLLVGAGTSMGGARPKAVIEDEDKLWLAKFNSPKDNWNNARVEHAMLKLAERCGIETAFNKVISVAGKDVLLLKRFDREKTDSGYLKHRMISALTVLEDTDDATRREKWSYLLLVEKLRKISFQAKEDARELFKRMVFNALISNTDDHPRNHAFIAKNKNWQLSPAYDLTPTPLISIEKRNLAMECGRYGRYANIYNLISGCKQFLLTQEEAEKVIKEMQDIIVSNWYAVSRLVGVSENDCEKIKTSFVYKGFYYDIIP